MRPLSVLLLAVALPACASNAPAPGALTLPMTVPQMPSGDAPKGEPLAVGVSVPVPNGAGEVDPARLAWSDDGRARVAVEWPGVDAFRLRLHADGHWPETTRVRVLGVDGEPLHIDTWAPGQVDRWWSAVAEDPRMVIEIDGRPRAGARLYITDAAALGVRR